jgi:hypothetical protein
MIGLINQRQRANDKGIKIKKKLIGRKKKLISSRKLTKTTVKQETENLWTEKEESKNKTQNPPKKVCPPPIAHVQKSPEIQKELIIPNIPQKQSIVKIAKPVVKPKPSPVMEINHLEIPTNVEPQMNPIQNSLNLNKESTEVNKYSPEVDNKSMLQCNSKIMNEQENAINVFAELTNESKPEKPLIPPPVKKPPLPKKRIFPQKKIFKKKLIPRKPIKKEDMNLFEDLDTLAPPSNQVTGQPFNPLHDEDEDIAPDTEFSVSKGVPLKEEKEWHEIRSETPNWQVPKKIESRQNVEEENCAYVIGRLFIFIFYVYNFIIFFNF